jgi:AcrR family transcriptional regulator
MRSAIRDRSSAPFDPNLGRKSQEERRAASTERLVAAALDLLSKKGSAGITLAEVGIAAGYSRGLAGERFGDKLGLLEVVIAFLIDWLNTRIATAVGDREGLDAVLKRVECHIDAALERPDYHRALYHLMMDSISTEPALHKSFLNLDRMHRRNFALHINHGQQHDQISQTIDASQQASMIVGIMRGMIIQAITSSDMRSLMRAKPELLRLVRLSLTC